MFKAELNPDFNVSTAVTAIGESYDPLKIALWGLQGNGKTTTAAEVGLGLVEGLAPTGKLLRHGGKICVLDTEALASKTLRQYPQIFKTTPWDFFGTAIRGTYLTPFDPRVLAVALMHLGKEFDVVILDTVSAFWSQAMALIEQITTAAAKQRSEARGNRDNSDPKGNKAAAWSVVTPIWEDFVTELRACPAHVICSLRGKMRFDDRGRPTGIGPSVRPEFVYDVDHVGRVIIQPDGKRAVHFGKGRHQFDGATFPADRTLGHELARWLISTPADVRASARADAAGIEELRDDDNPIPPEALGVTVGDEA